MNPAVSIDQFKALLPKICDNKTSSRPQRWTPDNTLLDHCAVVTLVAQNLFGGEMLRAEMVGQNDSHYWNKLPDNTEKDFTKDQFGDSYPELANTVARTRSYVLYDPKTGLPREIMKRYKLLAWRLARELNQDNPLFRDTIYGKCFCNALSSPCQKMKFGAVVVNQSGERNIESALALIEGQGYNKTIEPLKSLCEPTCIRLNIPSRTESMIGACGHAEEFALSEAVKAGVPLHKCDLYVAGVHLNGLPDIRGENEFKCLRCAVQIYNYGVRKVWVPTTKGWQSLSGKECVETALPYATGEKKV